MNRLPTFAKSHFCKTCLHNLVADVAQTQSIELFELLAMAMVDGPCLAATKHGAQDHFNLQEESPKPSSDLEVCNITSSSLDQSQLTEVPQ